MAISPDHFAAPGKRVISSYDESQVGTVTAWVAGDGYVVKWDDIELSTICYSDELEPHEESPKASTDTTPSALTVAEAVAAVKASCEKHGLDDYDGEAVAFLDALLSMESNGLNADDAVRRAYGVTVVEIVQRAKGDQPEEVVKTMTFANERLAEKAESGANINLDHDRYFTRTI